MLLAAIGTLAGARISSSALATPGAGRDADSRVESAREVALFRKPGIQCDVNQGVAAVSKQSLGTLDSGLHMPSMRRSAGRCLEGPAELGWRKVRQGRQFGELYRLVKIFADEIGDCGELADAQAQTTMLLVWPRIQAA